MRQSVSLLQSGIIPRDIPKILFPSYVDYLNWQVESQFFSDPNEINFFIANYLMCTAVGMVANQDEICVFWAGDGVIYLNNGVYRELVSVENRPTYPAYHLYERYGIVDGGIKSLLPGGFQLEVFPAEIVQTIGIASDGLIGHSTLLDELKAHATSNMSLQLCLNRITVLRSETVDNVSVIFAERKEV